MLIYRIGFCVHTSVPVDYLLGITYERRTHPTPGGQVSFWCGMIVPPPTHIAKSYALLGKASPAQVFPLRFESDVDLIGGPIAGDVPGFLILEDLKTRRIRVIT
jgi:hypothetical protein